MKNVIYGCGTRLKFLLSDLNVDYCELDFTDSDRVRWNTEFIDGKVIQPPSDIQPQEYDFCMIGSPLFSDEIKTCLIEKGFEIDRIVPFEYINGLWERWRKDETIGLWKKSIESENVKVVSNWHMIDDDAVCLLHLSNYAFCDIELCSFDLSKYEKRIEVYDAEDNSELCVFESKSSAVINNNIDKRVIKIVVKKSISGIPWITIHSKLNSLYEKVEACRLRKQFLSTYNELTDFPYYDEDYYLIKKLNVDKGTILDVGANYGQSMFSLYYLSKCNVVSFEVRPDLYEALLLMKDIIDKDNRITVVNCGVSDKCEQLTYYEPTNPILSGSFDKEFITGRNIGCDIIEKKMECKPLDELVDINSNIVFIKMDVEGLEYEALEGAKRIIQENHPLILIEQNEKLNMIIESIKDEYDLFYYDLQLDKFCTNRKSRLNCWLIPKEEYRDDIIRDFIASRI